MISTFLDFLLYLDDLDSLRSAYPLHNPDEPWEGRVLVTPLGVCVEVHALLLEYQLWKKPHRCKWELKQRGWATFLTFYCEPMRSSATFSIHLFRRCVNTQFDSSDVSEATNQHQDNLVVALVWGKIVAQKTKTDISWLSADYQFSPAVNSCFVPNSSRLWLDWHYWHFPLNCSRTCFTKDDTPPWPTFIQGGLLVIWLSWSHAPIFRFWLLGLVFTLFNLYFTEDTDR